MGFWKSVGQFFAHPIATIRGDIPRESAPEPTPEPEPGTVDYDGGTPIAGGPDGKYDWQLAGYLLGRDSYNPDYHNLDPTSPQARFGVESFTNWNFLPYTDYAVVKVIISGEAWYVTLAGPFGDEDDLAAAIADWYESGS